MATQSLAVKYRPKTFDDVTEQGSVRAILQNQLDSGEIKHAYLFCGGAGTGKTTCARIFANEINKHCGNPIEMDAASNNSVDDIRNVIEQSKTQSLDSEYKVFIIDECHMLSTGAWNAFLKVLEEPPAKSIFIMATTDPQKIPKTILSRVQRYDFQRISQDGIIDRLKHIIKVENSILCDKMGNDFGSIDEFIGMGGINEQDNAIEYIAKIADGGMRDAITMMDKCLAFSTDLTLENVVKALGTANYDVMFKLTTAIIDKDLRSVLQYVNDVHSSGKDIKLFIKSYTQFVLDLCKYDITDSFEFLQIPSLYEEQIKEYGMDDYDVISMLLGMLVKLNANLKWETSPKALVESYLITFISRRDEISE